MGRLLKRWGWSWQKPKRQDIRRDEAAIEHWRDVIWPELKKQAQEQKKTLIFVDESSFHLCSHHRKTFAPVGRTPAVKGKRGQSPRHMVMGAVSFQGRSYYSWTQGTVTGATIVTFLKTLLRYWRGKLRVIWDNAPVHRCREVREWLCHPDVQARLSLEPLPPYAPELNPTESLWSWIKRKRANLTFKDALGLGQWLKRTTSWIKRRRDHVRKLLKASPVH
tara:strand:+ start:564 stop:1226 length:663 start_codon:yes stop_codon:yes gene_type:complete